MSDEHLLPDDTSSWPRNPFHLLGVEPGASPRDLKRAYHALIRRYKPEHHPEAFRLIRDAYETAQHFQVSFEALSGAVDDTDDAPTTDDEPPAPLPPTADRPAPTDWWEVACQGDEAAAYRGLQEGLGTGRPTEDDFLQLYWLRVTTPAVDPDRAPGDWLVRGVTACGPSAARIRELLRRETLAAPEWALGDGLASLLGPETPFELALDVASWRWRAVRVLRRWAVIERDVAVLRARPGGVPREQRVRLLLDAATNFVWTLGSGGELVSSYRDEATRLAHELALNVDEELTRLEYAEAVVQGISRLNLKGVDEGDLHRLLALSWDDRGPDLRPRLLAFLRPLARAPQRALTRLDVLHAHAPAALGLLRELTGDPGRAPLDPPAVDAVEAFLASSSWSHYPAFRPALLDFCLRDMIPPASVSQLVAPRGGTQLAQAVSTDWPLTLVYRAYELSWE